MRRNEAQVEELLGQTIVEVRGEVGDEELVFVLSDGRAFVMYHRQSCCETVTLEDICGDIADLIGRPVVQAEEVSNGELEGRGDTSYTWTFYKIGTERGGVTIRWYGTSNGYYSESVDCEWRHLEARKVHDHEGER